MGLSKEQIEKILKKRFPEEKQDMIREVSYNLSLASVDTVGLEERAARALAKIRQKVAQVNPLARQAASAVKTKHSCCPICKVPMEMVKLLDDVPALYCQDHRVTVPIPAADMPDL